MYVVAGLSVASGARAPMALKGQNKARNLVRPSVEMIDFRRSSEAHVVTRLAVSASVPVLAGRVLDEAPSATLVGYSDASLTQSIRSITPPF